MYPSILFLLLACCMSCSWIRHNVLKEMQKYQFLLSSSLSLLLEIAPF